MPKHMFRRVKEGRAIVSLLKQGRDTASKVKRMVAGSVVMAFVPFALASSPLPSLQARATTPWETQLVLADHAPDLLAPTSGSEVKIEKVTSRYDEEQQRKAAEERKRVVAKPNVAVVADTMSESEKVELATKAAATYGIPAQLLIAVWKIESGMRAFTQVQSSVGAAGPFQFMPGTWRGYGVDGNGDGTKDIRDARDAAYAAAKLLAANGAAQGDYYRALMHYNHAEWYVDRVLISAGLHR